MHRSRIGSNSSPRLSGRSGASRRQSLEEAAVCPRGPRLDGTTELFRASLGLICIAPFGSVPQNGCMENVIIEASDYKAARAKADAMEPKLGFWLLFVGIVTGSEKSLFEFRLTKRIGAEA